MKCKKCGRDLEGDLKTCLYCGAIVDLKKSSKKCLFILISLLTIAVIGLSGYIVYDKVISKESEKGITETSNKTIKEDINKELVYDLSYDKKDIEEYYIDDWKEYRFFDDIKFPYINIDSEDAKKANEKLKRIYDEIIKQYNEISSSEYKIAYYKSSYDYTIYENILSIVVDVETGATDVPSHTYYSYNIDLDTKKVLSYEELYNRLGCKTANNKFDNTNLSKIMSEAITLKTRNLFESIGWDFENGVSDGRKYEDFVKENINNYEVSVKENSTVAFIDSKGMLNVVVRLVSGAGSLYGSNYIVSVTDDACYNVFIK